VAGGRAGIDGARGDRGGGDVALRKVIDRLRRGGAHHGEGDGAICTTAAVGDDAGAKRLQQTAAPVDRDSVAHTELMPLQAGLELFETIVGQSHRPAVAVKRGHETTVRHGAVVFRSVDRFRPTRLLLSMVAAPAATSCGDCVGTTRCSSCLSASYQALAQSGSSAAVSPDCVA